MATKQELLRKQKEIRKILVRNGTNVELNDRDPYGDGDQSRLMGSRKSQQAHRDLFAEGGDFFESASVQGTISDFSMMCMLGSVQKVEELLKRADDQGQAHAPQELVHLLEKRETSMRCSPLLLLVSVGKNLGGFPEQHKQQIKVAEVLLRYGARPDARDVVGKTVCHYGAGAMATEATMKIVQLASKAAESAHLFNKEVELFGLKNAAKNGARGVARGYICESGRRSVFLIDDKSCIAVKPGNLRLHTRPITDIQPVPRLCDIPCRLGATSLLETIQSNREDVAKFLTSDLGASIDIKDNDEVSARSMAVQFSMGAAARVVSNVATQRGKEEARTLRRQCAYCGKPEPNGIKFSQCSLCLAVRYCQKSCQGK